MEIRNRHFVRHQTWSLETKRQSSARVTSTLNYWASSLPQGNSCLNPWKPERLPFCSQRATSRSKQYQLLDILCILKFTFPRVEFSTVDLFNTLNLLLCLSFSMCTLNLGIVIKIIESLKGFVFIWAISKIVLKNTTKIFKYIFIY